MPWGFVFLLLPLLLPVCVPSKITHNLTNVNQLLNPTPFHVEFLHTHAFSELKKWCWRYADPLPQASCDSIISCRSDSGNKDNNHNITHLPSWLVRGSNGNRTGCGLAQHAGSPHNALHSSSNYPARASKPIGRGVYCGFTKSCKKFQRQF